MPRLAAHPRARQLTATFLSALQAEGYPLGVGHHQAVQELLERLPDTAPETTLRDGLVALLATSATDQAQYRQLFAQAQRQVDAMAGAAPTKTANPFREEQQRDRRKLLLRLTGLLGILLIPILAYFLWPEQEIVLPERTVTVTESRRNFLPELDSLPELGRISGYDLPVFGSENAPLLGRVDTTGRRVFYEAGVFDSLRREDAFVLTVHGSQKRFADLHYKVIIQRDTTRARPQVPGEDEGAGEDEPEDIRPDYSPMELPHPRTLADLAVAEPQGVGWADFLHYAWWPLLLLGFAALLFGYYLYLRYQRRKDIRLIAERDQFDGAPHFWRIELPDLRAAIDWGVNYPALLRQLRRRREDDHRELDLPGSIQQTINQGGLPTFTYRSTTRPAEYLLLIDRGVHANHYTRLFDELYGQLAAEEVLIERYFYDGDPRLLYKDDRAKAVPLASLQRRYANSRLLLVGPGDRLLSPATGKLAKWATEQFGGWESRSLLTTLPPGQWGVEERRLGQFFALLPATMQGLRLLVERTNDGETGEGAIDVNDLIDDADRSPVRLSGSIVGSLLDHFSLSQTQWIAACALYPSLHWDLTLFFGQTVGEQTGENLLTSRNLLALARIPWFTNGSIPSAARAELTRWLQETAPALHQSLRQSLHDVLEKHAPAPEGSVARRDLDFFRLQNEWLLAVDDPGRRAALSEQLAREIAAGNDPDITVARLLEGPPPEGAILLPESWNERLYPGGYPALGNQSEIWQVLPGLLYLVPLLLVGWLFQPNPEEGLGRCSAPTLTVLDTVSFARDLLIDIQICDRLDTLILQEHGWQERINRAASVADLDSVPLSYLMWQVTIPDGRKIMTPRPGGAMALSSLLEREPRDSLERTLRENVGAMLWNKGRQLVFLYGAQDEISCEFIVFARYLTSLTPGQNALIVACEESPRNADFRRDVEDYIESLERSERVLGRDEPDTLGRAATLLTDIDYWIIEQEDKLLEGGIFTADDLKEAQKLMERVESILHAEREDPQPLPNTDAPSGQESGDAGQEAVIQGVPTTTSVPAEADESVTALPQDLTCPSNTCGDFQVNANWTVTSNPKQATLTMENRSNAGIDYFVVDWGDGAVDTVRNYANLRHDYAPALVARGGTVRATLRGVTVCDGGVSCEEVSYTVDFAGKGAAAVPRPVMVSIPGGTFEMGDTFGEGEEDELPVHEVTLSSFEMGKYEVTFEEYDLYQQNVAGVDRPNDRGWGRGRRPVIHVSWWDGVKYCNWLSEQHGYKPVYTINEAKESITANWQANGYRLPTEAEWEYAAAVRPDGTKARFGNGRDTLRAGEASFNASASNVQPYSTAGEYRNKTLPVGGFTGNVRGLTDMAGNVEEWCWDLYDSKYYVTSAVNNPAGVGAGAGRVIRGGSWRINPSICRAANRNSNVPSSRYSSVGFRLARSL